MSAPVIRSRPRPTCFLCGSEGLWLYRGQVDLLFGCPGTWGFRRCPNAACSLVWLDPVPVAEDLPLAYARYHTHGRSSLDLPRRIYRALRGATPYHWARSRRERLYVPEGPPGRALDVGCGDGTLLRELIGRGWDAVGVEPDPEAVRAARREVGDVVFPGTVDEAPFDPASFDVVTLEHVVEHVEDPVELLRRCRGLLKPGGRLCAVTPNVDSLGHRTFRAGWRGLEPPRHLTLFSRVSLEAVARRAGFRAVESSTTSVNAWSIAFGSRPDRAGPLLRGVHALLFHAEAVLHRGHSRFSGEELVLRAGL